MLRREAGRIRTTARWQAAMVRAAARLQGEAAQWSGLRLPIAAALVETFPSLSDDELASMVEAMLPVEEAELAAVFG